jgi:putative transposase
VKEKVLLVDRKSKTIPIKRKAELLGIAQSTVYYQPIVDSYSLKLMHLIDEEYTKTPFYGSRRMREALKRKGCRVNRKRV